MHPALGQYRAAETDGSLKPIGQPGFTGQSMSKSHRDTEFIVLHSTAEQTLPVLSCSLQLWPTMLLLGYCSKVPGEYQPRHHTSLHHGH